MKFLLLLLFVSAVEVSAQTAPQSILSQIPYIPESSGEITPPRLDVRDALKGVEPLPDFEIPQSLPSEFIVSPRARKSFEVSMEANRFLVEGTPEKAVEIFRETLDKLPDELGLRVALADSLYAMGNHREAVDQYQRVLEKIPLHFQCLNNLAWLHATTSVADLKNLEIAEMLAEKAKVVQPRSHHLWSTLSQIYYETGEYSKAQNAINNALALAQQSQVTLNIVVSYLIQRDRCTLALQATSLLE